MPLLYSGMTDIGRKRKTNQDSIYMNPEKKLFIVADGMGGHNGGDIASAMAVKYVPEYLLANNHEPIGSSKESIRYANTVIHNKAQTNELLKGMGTTVVSFFFVGNTLYIANVGDSRAYLVQQHKLFQLSRDHSLVQEKLCMGIYDREAAANDSMKNVLVRTVGYEENVEADVFTYKVCANDILFICSDGLHSKVSDSDILHIVNTNLPNPAAANQDTVQKTVQALVDQANANGGNDNISVIMVLAV